jgi:hypothetical protein
MNAHTHQVNMASHNHTIFYDTSGSSGTGTANTYASGNTVPSSFNVTVDQANLLGFFGDDNTVLSSQLATISGVTASNAGRDALNIFTFPTEQPYIAFNYIIKT